MRDRMGIIREDASEIPDYGSLYLRERGKIYGDTPTSINEYGASDDADIDLLPLLSDGSPGSAAPGSTCLFHSGDLYILGLSGWAKFGGTAGNRSVTTSRSVFDTPTDDDTDGGEMR